MNYGQFESDMTALVAALTPQIGDEYRVEGQEADDETPLMCLTIGADAWGWGYQTGDNSYTGGAYGYSNPWAIVTLARDSVPADVAKEIVDQLCGGSGDEIFEEG